MAQPGYKRNWPISDSRPTSFQTYAQNATTAIIDPPSAAVRGATAGTCRAVWQVKIDESLPPVTGHAAIEIGRFGTRGIRVPIVGEQLYLTLGSPSSLTDNIYRSGSLYAYDFVAVAPNGNTVSWLWEIEVTYRAPLWGEDEVPGTAHLPPLERFAEFKWDYFQESRQTSRGWPVDEIEDDREDAEDGDTVPRVGRPPDFESEVMFNSAGRPTSSYSVSRKLSVLRILWNVRDAMLSKKIVDAYDGTINNDIWSLNTGAKGERAAQFFRYSTRFADCEQWYAGDWLGVPYYRIEVRLIVAKDAYDNFERIPNADVVAKSGNAYITNVTEQGIPNSGPSPLTDSGRFAGASDDQTEKVYCLFRPVPYRGALWAKVKVRP